MDWKNRLERTIGMNTAVVKAEQNNFLNKKVIEDLEFKNKVLHRCAYTAHNEVSSWLTIPEAEWDSVCWYTKFEDLKKKMESILEESSNQAIQTKPSIQI
jgi:hypothetical protein